MYCPKLKRILGNLLIVGLLLFLSTTNTFAAYTSVSLSPASGKIYSNNTAITVLVNSGSDKFIGIDVDISFTGPISYVSSTQLANCTSMQAVPSSGKVNITCFNTNDATYSGAVVTMYFKSTGAGTATFSITSADPNATTKTGGTYTVVTTASTDSGSGSGGTGNSGSGTNLPQSGIFDDSKSLIYVGGILLLIGMFLNKILNGLSFLSIKTTERVNSLKNNAKEEKVENLRKKMEKKFS